MATKKMKYVEPEGYFPKKVRDEFFGKGKKKTTAKKTTKKK